jgi:hypothetical protein
MEGFNGWSIGYWVNKEEEEETINYGASCFKFFTPWFGFIIRFYDAIAINYTIASRLEVAWGKNTREEGNKYYKQERVIFEKIHFTLKELVDACI